MNYLNRYNEIKDYDSSYQIINDDLEDLEDFYGKDWKIPKKDFYYAEERKDSPTTI